MCNIYEIKEINYTDKIRSLTNKAAGVVKSNKFFPVYNFNYKEYIFKPLSKTKPVTTPFYSISEVFWSYIINKYFVAAPRYRLSKCHGYEEHEPKHMNLGCLVSNILNTNEYLVNLLEYFQNNPDKNVDINEYINCCILFYDYTCIFESEIIKNDKELGEKLALQVLISVLKADQNYHYENIAFIFHDSELLDLAPMIDHEFSTFFLFPEELSKNYELFSKFIKDIQEKGTLYKNMEYICIHYPDIAGYFVRQLNKFKADIYNFSIPENAFTQPCNSYMYEIGIERYKTAMKKST